MIAARGRTSFAGDEQGCTSSLASSPMPSPKVYHHLPPHSHRRYNTSLRSRHLNWHRTPASPPPLQLRALADAPQPQ